MDFSTPKCESEQNRMNQKLERHWIAVYTKSRSENKVTLELESKGITCFLPQRQQLRQWSDRKKIITVPLIPSYVFVYIELSHYHRVFESDAVVKVLTFNNRIAVVRPHEIEVLRLACGEVTATVESGIANRIGNEVEITEGVFAGYSGIVLGRREGSKVAIQIQELGLSVVVSAPANQVRLKEAV